MYQTIVCLSMCMLNGLTDIMKSRTTFRLLLLIPVAFLLLLYALDFLKPVVKRIPTEMPSIDVQVRDEARHTNTANAHEDAIGSNTDEDVGVTPNSNIDTKPEMTSESENDELQSEDLYTKRIEHVVNKGNSEPTQGEVTHIAFLKVHKAASSTVQSIIQRFGLKRNLSFVIPDPVHYISKQKIYFSDLWPPIPLAANTTDLDASLKYDILCNHMVFNHKKVSRLLYSDSKYIAIVREPLDQFLSAAFYYKFVWRFPYLERLSNETFITDLIRKPNQSEATTMAESMTYNSMAYDFGLEFDTLKRARNISEEKFKVFLNKTGEIFHLVMLVERFDESLVLMKRYLNWSLEDILYIKTNTYLSGLKNDTLKGIKITANDKKILRKRNKFDYALYEFFKARLEAQISEEANFREEVEQFKRILSDVQEFCEEELREMEKIKQSFKSVQNDTYFNKQDTGHTNDSESKEQRNEVQNKERMTVKDEGDLGHFKTTTKDSQEVDDSEQKRFEKTTPSVIAQEKKKLLSVINSTIQKKKLTNDQEVEIRGLSNFRDKTFNTLTVKYLTKLLPLLFYDKGQSVDRKSELLISKSKWNKNFFVAVSDCKLMTFDEMTRYRYVKEKHLKHLVRRKFGDSFSVKEALEYVDTFY